MPDKGSTGFADDICRVRTYLAGKTRPGPLRTRHGAILPPLALRSHPAGDRDTATPWPAGALPATTCEGDVERGSGAGRLPNLCFISAL